MPANTAAHRSIDRLGSRPRAFLAVASGATVALGQAPFDLPLVAMAGLVSAVSLCLCATDLRRAARLGWWVGVGYFAVVLHWIVEPFLVDIARHGWMAPFALVLMAAGMALFWALGFAGSVALAANPSLLRRGLALTVTLTLAEMLRSVIFTGFPWGLIGTIWVETPVQLLAAWVGPHGLGALSVLLAVLISVIALTPALRMRLAATGAGLALALAAFGGGVWRDGRIAPAPQDAPMVRIVQPNAAQQDKWRPEMMAVFWQRQIDLTLEAGAPTDLVIWPEVSLPYLLATSPFDDEVISEAAGGVPVIVGAQRFDGDRLMNSLAVITAPGTVAEVYDKHHLVPFGEYIPGGEFVQSLGLTGLATSALGGFSAGPGARTIDLSAYGLGRVLPLICYEAIFPRHATAPGPRADWIVQITNDAWFGTFAGPQQHLAQARMRAVEQGLPLARSANTGVSAMIDPGGRITAALALNEAGALDVPLPPPLPPTLFARYANIPLLVILAGLAILLFAPSKWRSRPVG